jgi:PIN domain nuclease of toxin-antitoxin system
MRYLVDTHLLLWFLLVPTKLSALALSILADSNHALMFSTSSVWEVAIKFGLQRDDFTISPQTFRLGLLDNQFEELAITSEQTFAVSTLPLIHKDPFDRLLVAQAMVESMLLLTADPAIARYPGPIRLV